MKWTIREIVEHPDDLVTFDVELSVREELLKRDTEIIDIEPVKVNGYFVAVEKEVILHGEINANITLPSTRTLKPVSVDLQIPIKERYVDSENEGNIDDYEETTIVLEHDYVDLSNAVIDSILLNLPVQVIGPDEDDDNLPSGRDWVVLTEEKYEQQQQETQETKVDPRFEKLRNLINDDEDSIEE